jgi:phosphatidylserine/phosphatidylglycerophosphate/cardiolipin synthase-like enzyme/uncharacterized membrane protein YdjX (TVP38/TMEM64 family)
VPDIHDRSAPDARASATLLREGANCWRVAHADHVALLVDADEYFTAFAAAAARARRSILILSWDFNSRTRLIAEDPPRGSPPPVLGDFLNHLARRRRGLEVRVLIWDYPMIFGVDREFPSGWGIGWKPHRRVCVRYDNTHPVAGSHHQKIAVIDDAVAFCGGIDLTCRRWDTCEHRPDDDRRRCDGEPYPPMHDVMMMVDGSAARALGDLARARWQRATGRLIRPVGGSKDCWPAEMSAQLRDVDVAVSRTDPASDGGPGAREIEKLYVDMIASARRYLYIENQYLTAQAVGDALVERLAAPDCPEVIIVLRLLSHGWLEEVTMQNLRKALIERLRAADTHGRLHVYYPHVEGLTEGTCIDVHSKLLIADDEWLRVGSANLSNRSMGYDTECDLTIEAHGRSDVRDEIASFRDRLLGEHLGVAPERVREALQGSGSISGAIESLREDERTLRSLESEPEASETVIALAGLADPERPVRMDELIGQLAPRIELKRSGIFWPEVVGFGVLLIGLAALWRYTPVAAWISAERITAWAKELSHSWWAALALVAAYLPASAVMFPRALITLFAVVAFGPLLGFALAMSGVLIAAFSTYAAGMRLERSTVRRISGPKLTRIIRVLRERGVVAITALRLVPLAPFAVEGLIAGAIRIRLFDFMMGTFLGMLPGTLAATLLGEQLQAALRNPSEVNLWLIGGVVVALVVATLSVRRWLLTTELETERTASNG